MAAEQGSKWTLAHYDEVVGLARTAGPEQIARTGIMDWVMIARPRVETPPGFASMDGAGLPVDASVYDKP